MFRFLHGYVPGVWEAQVKAGIVGENDGIRFCQSLKIKDEFKFNNLAKKGGELHKILKERKCPFYIDRLQGGSAIQDYHYDEELLKEYKELLGDNFWGFQMHEWVTNYRHDLFVKLKDLPESEWTKENIEKTINEKYRLPDLLIESMTAQEMADAGKPKNFEEFFRNITNIYKKRLKIGELIPCDSSYIAYAYEVSCGTKRLMPEVGAQTHDSRIQICYARGMTRKEGRSFGVYYEPWGGIPFSTCCYHKENKNEWNANLNNIAFDIKGPNGGSSRSLQRRIFLYGYLSGAEFMSEEWGVCNVFYDWKDFELTPYGKVKKEFMDFTRKYTDIGDKLAPMAVVLPKDYLVLDRWYEDNLYCGFEVNDPTVAKVKQGLREIFTKVYPMLGTEIMSLRNSEIPDAIDILNEDEEDLAKYDYLVDLTNDPDFNKRYNNVCQIEDVKKILLEYLPCVANGNSHWMVNKCTTGGYYLTVFNHSGIERSDEKGEVALEQAQTRVSLQVKNGLTPTLLEGDGVLSNENGKFEIVIPAGGWAFIKLA